MQARRPDAPNLNLAREAAAARELGQTRVRPALAWLLTLAFLATLLLGPLLEGLAPTGQAPTIADLVAEWPTGCSLRAFERGLEERSALARTLRPRAQAFLTDMLRRGNAQVWVGREGWLFLKRGVEHLTGPPFLDASVQRARRRAADPCGAGMAPDALAALTAFGAALQQRGVALLVVPTPVKAAIHPEKLTGHDLSTKPLANPSMGRFLEQLDAAGVGVFDPAAAIEDWILRTGRPAYLATDTHWRPEAMDDVARALARVVESRLGEGGRRVRWERQPIEVRNAGSLVGLLGLSPTTGGPPSELVTIQQVRDPQGEPWRPDPTARVLLLGDSFSNIYSEGSAFVRGFDGDLHWGEGAGLGEQLAYHMGRPLDKIVMNGGGASGTRRELAAQMARAAAKGRDRLASVRVVVLQLSTRSLSWDSFEEIPLPAAPSSASAAPRDANAVGALAGRHLEVRGTVAARSASPDPAEAAYPDALFAVHLVDIEGPDAPSEAVVYLLGMHQHARTDAAAIRPGAALRLRLVPWQDAEIQRRFATLFRTELDDLELLTLPAYFGEAID